MRIQVNGQPREIPSGMTVESLLRLLELPPGRVAVERNRRVVPRSRHADAVLEEGDTLELVRFVGGG